MKDTILRAQHLGWVIAALLASSCIGATESRRSQSTGNLVVGLHQKIALTINGRPVSMTVDPGIGARRLLNESVARSMELKGSGIQGLYRIGPVDLIAHSASLQVSSNRSRAMARFHWFDRDVSADSDGLLSPAVMPFARVTFQLRQSVSGEETRSIPFRGTGMFGFGGGEGLLTLNGQEVSVGLDPKSPETVVSAAVAADLIDVHGGTFSGPTENRVIRYGVMRPVRKLRLNRPLEFAGVRIETLLVRTHEAGRVSDASASTEDDAEEIVVVGSKRKQKRSMTIGANDLRHCSFFRVNNSGSTLDFACRSNTGDRG